MKIKKKLSNIWSQTIPSAIYCMKFKSAGVGIARCHFHAHFYLIKCSLARSHLPSANANIKLIHVLSVIAARNGFSLCAADAMSLNSSGILQLICLIVGDISGRLSSPLGPLISRRGRSFKLIEVTRSGGADESRETEKVQRLSRIELNEQFPSDLQRFSSRFSSVNHF